MIGQLGEIFDGGCGFCSRKQEGVRVEFEDGSLLGHLRFTESRRALRMQKTTAEADTRAKANGHCRGVRVTSSVGLTPLRDPTR